MVVRVNRSERVSNRLLGRVRRKVRLNLGDLPTEPVTMVKSRVREVRRDRNLCRGPKVLHPTSVLVSGTGSRSACGESVTPSALGVRFLLRKKKPRVETGALEICRGESFSGMVGATYR